jgi:hypothetical protein
MIRNTKKLMPIRDRIPATRSGALYPVVYQITAGDSGRRKRGHRAHKSCSQRAVRSRRSRTSVGIAPADPAHLSGSSLPFAFLPKGTAATVGVTACRPADQTRPKRLPPNISCLRCCGNYCSENCRESGRFRASHGSAGLLARFAVAN